MNQRRAAEFFAGIGLMRMGLDHEGWTTVWANDLDEKKWEMYRDNFPDSEPHFKLDDVHDIKGKDIPDIELATASFPCNDLSLAGSRHGLAGTQSSAFWGFVDAIKGMGKRRPPLVLLENVAGFLTSNDGNDFRDALLALNELGYAVDAFIIDASRFVPQSRQRLFVVGSKAASNTLKEALRTFMQSDVRPPALADFIFMNPEIGWAIRSLPPLPPSTERLADIIEDVPLNSELWWSKERCDYLLNQMSDKHRAEAERMMAGSKWSYGTVFRRVRNGRSMGELRTDGIAGCLRTPRGGSGRQILFCAGRGQYRVRLLTPRECSRLMGADDYKINVPLNQALFGFGDAVCVPVIQWIARHYLNPVLDEMRETLPTAPCCAKRSAIYDTTKSSEGQDMNDAIKQLEALVAKQRKFLNKGGLCVGLVVTKTAQEKGLPLNPIELRTEEGGQVAGLGKAAVQNILAAYGITKVLAEEGGRTSRGSLGLMETYVSVLNAIAAQKPKLDLEPVMDWWMEKVRLYFASEGPKFSFDPGKSVAANLAGLFEQAVEIQRNSGGANFVGALLQHLVGAKLDIVLGTGVAEHHGFSVADHSTERQADFEVNGVAIHVTTHPSEALVRKMAKNLQAGLKPVVVTLADGVEGAAYLLKNTEWRDRIDIIDATQFLTANVYERSLFRAGECKATLTAILTRYNEIVASCETDPVLQIRF